jgi:nucleoside-triphosphatase
LTQLDLEHAPSRLIVLDEIGRMECFSQRFVDAVTALLNSSKLLIATIALKGEGFIRDVKARPDCRLVMVTRENRDHLPGEIATEVQEILRERAEEDR